VDLSELTRTRSWRTPSTERTVERSAGPLSPKMLVAEAGIVPGEPSGRTTTRSTLPFHLLKPVACSSRPKRGWSVEVTLTSHGSSCRNCCSLSLSRWGWASR
jgi:hypothetical protein